VVARLTLDPADADLALDEALDLLGAAGREERRELGDGRKGAPTKGCRSGFLPYDDLRRWPAELLVDGLPLRDRLRPDHGPCPTAVVHEEDGTGVAA
jgi:hypothetical protein